MKFVLSSCSVALFLISYGFAQIPKGFEEIFNGEDLTGWSGSAKWWSVVDGVLTGTTDGTLKSNQFLIFEGEPLKNFELRVKVRINETGNSGLQYRSLRRPDLGKGVVSGSQCDIVGNAAGFNGMLYEERGRRILARTGQKVVIDEKARPWIIDKMPVQKFPSDEWHDYRILAQGNHLRHWIDGHCTVDVIDCDEAGRLLQGLLAVQVHTGAAMKVELKDIYLKRLADDLPLLNPEIPPNAILVTPQGKLPDDWVAPMRKEVLAAETEATETDSE